MSRKKKVIPQSIVTRCVRSAMRSQSLPLIEDGGNRATYLKNPDPKKKRGKIQRIKGWLIKEENDRWIAEGANQMNLEASSLDSLIEAIEAHTIEKCVKAA